MPSIKQEWHVLLSDREWARSADLGRLLAELEEEPEPERKHRSRRRLWIGLGLAGILVAALGGLGLLLWQQAQAGLVKLEADVARTVALEEELRRVGREALLLDPQAPPEWQQDILVRLRQGPVAEVQLLQVDIQGEWAVVQVAVQAPDRPLPYRETRLYRRAADGQWLRTAPEPELWGPEETLESRFFRFHFRSRDRDVVLLAASRLDAAYVQGRARLGLPLPPEPSAPIAVQVESQGGRPPRWNLDRTAITVPSPHLMALPQGLAPEEALVEGALDLLRREAIREAMFRLGDEATEVTSVTLQGIRLWSAWEDGDPLSEYRDDLLGWFYGRAPESPGPMPERLRAVCQLLDVWKRPGWHLGVTLPCSGPVLLDLTAVDPRPPALRLVDLAAITWRDEIRMRPRERALRENVQGKALALATLLSYISWEFGPDRIPGLLGPLATQASWEFTGPDHLGVDAEALEAGWHAYLEQIAGVEIR